MDRLHHLRRRHSYARELCLRNLPALSNDLSVFRILDIARTGQLIAALAVLARALAVPLTGDREIAAAGF